MSLLLPSPSLIAQLQQNLRFQKQTRPADAAVLVALTDEAEPRILLTRRAAQMRQHAGEVSFPGGKREKGDTSNIVVALREAQEETALSPFDVKLLGELPMQKARNGILVKPIVGLIPAQPHLIAEPSEIDRIFFMPLQDFIQHPAQAYRVEFKKQTIYMPSVPFEQEIVWGLTARILVALLHYGLGHQKDWPFLLNAPSSSA